VLIFYFVHGCLYHRLNVAGFWDMTMCNVVDTGETKSSHSPPSYKEKNMSNLCCNQFIDNTHSFINLKNN
jgi:hypothetical protein